MWAPVLLCSDLTGAAQQTQKSVPAVTVRLMTIDIKVATDGSSTQTQHIEVQAANDAGVQQISQTSVPYDATVEEITILDAHTLKPDGKILPVDAGAIYDRERPGQDTSIISGLRSKLIVFPQLAAGDVAIYTVKATTKHPMFDKQFVYGQVFVRTWAYDNVRETITAPKTIPLYVESHDVEAGQQDDGANVTYSWHYSAPKPIAELPVTLSPLEHEPRFFASSFKDYAQVGRAYAALAEPKRVVTPKIRALADEITAGASDQKAQAQKLYEWVSAHIRYVAIELGTGSYVPHDVDSIVANGYGDCKDHDILLQALLKAKGIDAESILINGGVSYTLTNIPTFTALNHVITFLPQFNLYLDSSAGVAPFGILPLQEYGKPMVVASAMSAGLGKTPLVPPGLAKVMVKTVLTLDKDGTLSGTTTTTASGPYAINLRLLNVGIQGLGPTAVTKLLTAMGYENPTGSFTQNSPVGFAPDYTISSTFKTSGWGDNLSGKDSFYLPHGLMLLDLPGDNVMGPLSPGKLKSDEPTLCFSAEQSEDVSLKAPPGYQFNGLPNNIRVEMPNLLFVANWSLAGDTLSLHREFTSKIDQPLCSGSIRTQSAAALKRIADSYQQQISFAKQDHDGDKASKAAQAFYNSGFSHYNAGRYELSIADFDKAVALKPDDFDFYDARGSAYAYLGQKQRAIDNFDHAIKLKKDNYNVYAERGIAHQALEQYDLALADFSRAIALNPEDIEAYSHRGAVYLSMKQIPSAIADFDKVIATDPNGEFAYDSYFNRAVARTEDKPDLALADFDKALALQPDAYRALTNRAALKAKKGQWGAAIADLDKALSLQPGEITILNIRAVVHYRAENYKLAIADYDKIIAQKPNSPEALYNRGGAKIALGQREEGERDLAAARKLDPAVGQPVILQ